MCEPPGREAHVSCPLVRSKLFDGGGESAKVRNGQFLLTVAVTDRRSRPAHVLMRKRRVDIRPRTGRTFLVNVGPPSVLTSPEVSAAGRVTEQSPDRPDLPVDADVQ